MLVALVLYIDRHKPDSYPFPGFKLIHFIDIHFVDNYGENSKKNRKADLLISEIFNGYVWLLY